MSLPTVMPTKGETASVSVQELLRSQTISPKLAARIQEADINQDGNLSIEELLEVIRSEERAVSDRKLMRNFLIALVVAVLILIATLCGTVYAIVKLTQEVNDNNGVLVSSSTGQPMSTAAKYLQLSPDSLYRYPDPSLLQSFEALVLPSDDGDTMYRVAKIVSKRNDSATVYTIDGTVIEVDDSGMSIVDKDAPAGSARRLRYMTDEQVSSVYAALGVYDLVDSLGGRNKIENTIVEVGNEVAEEVTSWFSWFG